MHTVTMSDEVDEQRFAESNERVGEAGKDENVAHESRFAKKPESAEGASRSARLRQVVMFTILA